MVSLALAAAAGVHWMSGIAAMLPSIQRAELPVPKTIHTVEDLLRAEIVWRSKDGAWSAIVEGQECVLVMNDFPDEPLYTLRWRDQSIDFDDAPSCWRIPRP